MRERRVPGRAKPLPSNSLHWSWCTRQFSTRRQKKAAPSSRQGGLSVRNPELLRHGALFESLFIESSDGLVGGEGLRGLDLADGPAGSKVDLNVLDTRLVGESRTDARSTSGGSGHAWNIEHDGLQVGSDCGRRSRFRSSRRLRTTVRTADDEHQPQQDTKKTFHSEIPLEQREKLVRVCYHYGEY